MKMFFLIGFLLFIGLNSSGQAWVWEKPLNLSSNSIAKDPNDNIIVLSRNGNTATILSKFTKDGLPVWNKRLTKSGTFTPSGVVVADNSGNIYTFTEGFDSLNSVFTGVKLRGITKFDPQGNIEWHTDFYSSFLPSGTYSANQPKTLAIDDNNNLYAAYSEAASAVTLHLGNLSLITNNQTNYLSVASVSSAGTPRWLRGFKFKDQIGGAAQATMTTISVSGSRLFITGYLGKSDLFLDNGLTLSGNRCTAWFAAFNGSTGISDWGKAHNLYEFCIGLICGCSSPSIASNTSSGKLALTNNLYGAFTFAPGNNITSAGANKSYYTVYDTLGNPVKGQIIEPVSSVVTDFENIVGSRNNFFFVQYRDTLRKVDTGFNLIWKVVLPPATEKIFIPQNSNDIIATYIKGSGMYIAKMVDSAAVISGKIYADWDNNGNFTSADSVLKNILVTTNSPLVSGVSSSDSGKYYLYALPGAYTIAAHFDHPYYSFIPAAQTATVVQNSQAISGKDFRLAPLMPFTDVAAHFSSLGFARPGFPASYIVTATNYGPTAQPIDVGLKLPALTSYIAASGATVTVNAPDSITISMGSLDHFQTKKATITLGISSTATLTDTLKYYPVAYPYTTDLVQNNNRDTLLQQVRSSFDPNEKDVNLKGQPIADSSRSLTYTVHFQNTGNDTAFYVRITDTISSKLDAGSFNFIDASHPLTTEIKANVISFIFNPIFLPDSNHNLLQSNGYVKFSIKPRSPVSIVDTIYNKASIYFDYNIPVVTNSTKTWFYDITIPVKLQSFTTEKRLTDVLLKLTTASEYDLRAITVERSSDGVNFNSIGTLNPRNLASGTSYSFVDAQPVNGMNYYRIKFTDIDGRISYSWIAAVNFKKGQDQLISIFPNPVADNVYINLRLNGSNKMLSCRIFDAAGKTWARTSIDPSNRTTYSINTSFIPNGTYFIEVTNTGTSFRQQIVVSHGK